LLTLPKNARTRSSFAVVVTLFAVTVVVLFELATVLFTSNAELVFTP
jgi:hypothetical protein